MITTLVSEVRCHDYNIGVGGGMSQLVSDVGYHDYIILVSEV